MQEREQPESSMDVDTSTSAAIKELMMISDDLTTRSDDNPGGLCLPPVTHWWPAGSLRLLQYYCSTALD